MLAGCLWRLPISGSTKLVTNLTKMIFDFVYCIGDASDIVFH